MIDLDMEAGRTPNPERPPNNFLLLIKPTGKIRMAALDGYLRGKAAWDNTVLECMSKWRAIYVKVKNLSLIILRFP